MSGKPQIKLAAVKVGDLLKYSTTVNEINRTGSSVFAFGCESFPIEGVTSQRAKLIFDWLMTLFKQALPDSDKRELATVFLTNITPETEREQIFRVLVDTSIIDATDLAPTTRGPAIRTSPEDELLKLAFRPELLKQLPLDVSLSELLADRMKEANACINGHAYLAAVIIAGSVLEGICLGVGSQNPERVNRTYGTHYGKRAPAFQDWKLKEWVEVLGHLGDLSPNIEKFGHGLRDFRNYVHPAEQLANRFVPDKHTARIGFHVVVAAIEDLVRARERQTKESV